MLIQEKLERLLDYVDRNGKKLIYKADEGGRVYLDIDGCVRCLGHVLLGKRNIIYTKFEDESQLFRKTNAWSINHTILNVVDYIHYETRTFDYHITKERALEFGEFFHFQDTTELKVYVPLKYWEKRRKGMASVYPQEFAYRNAIGDSWYEVLKEVMHGDLIKGISTYLKARRKVVTVYPESDRVFRALKLSTFEHTKVVIVGQDPYYDGVADGLAFSYLNGAKKLVPKSLDVIYKEVERSVYNNLHLDHDYQLDHWAKQGVLLLNAVLTVEAGKPKSHSDTEVRPGGIGWERFTKIVLWELINDKRPKVFMGWGAVAQAHLASVKLRFSSSALASHYFLNSPHPASDLYKYADKFGDVAPAYPNTFSGCNHFSLCNLFLQQTKQQEIKW